VRRHQLSAAVGDRARPAREPARQPADSRADSRPLRTTPRGRRRAARLACARGGAYAARGGAPKAQRGRCGAPKAGVQLAVNESVEVPQLTTAPPRVTSASQRSRAFYNGRYAARARRCALARTRRRGADGLRQPRQPADSRADGRPTPGRLSGRQPPTADVVAPIRSDESDPKSEPTAARQPPTAGCERATLPARMRASNGPRRRFVAPQPRLVPLAPARRVQARRTAPARRGGPL
jgi:hypothetical protein